jgi:hypothetical protein
MNAQHVKHFNDLAKLVLASPPEAKLLDSEHIAFGSIVVREACYEGRDHKSIGYAVDITVLEGGDDVTPPYTTVSEDVVYETFVGAVAGAIALHMTQCIEAWAHDGVDDGLYKLEAQRRTAWHDGHAAYFDGKGEQHCPHTDELAGPWLAGWAMAQMDNELAQKRWDDQTWGH